MKKAKMIAVMAFAIGMFSSFGLSRPAGAATAIEYGLINAGIGATSISHFRAVNDGIQQAAIAIPRFAVVQKGKVTIEYLSADTTLNREEFAGQITLRSQLVLTSTGEYNEVVSVIDDADGREMIIFSQPTGVFAGRQPVP